MSGALSDHERVVDFLCQRIAHYTGEARNGISLGDDPLDFGLSSLDAARICGEIGKAFGAHLDPAEFFECTSIQAIAERVLPKAFENAHA